MWRTERCRIPKAPLARALHQDPRKTLSSCHDPDPHQDPHASQGFLINLSVVKCIGIIRNGILMFLQSSANMLKAHRTVGARWAPAVGAAVLRTHTQSLLLRSFSSSSRYLRMGYAVS